MKNMTNTQFFQAESGPQNSAKDILEIVYKALKEKGRLTVVTNSM